MEVHTRIIFQTAVCVAVLSSQSENEKILKKENWNVLELLRSWESVVSTCNQQSAPISSWRWVSEYQSFNISSSNFFFTNNSKYYALLSMELQTTLPLEGKRI